MDWTTIISALIGVVSGGGITGIFLYREHKGGAVADAVQKSAEAMEKMLDNAIKQQETANKQAEFYIAQIEDRNKTIAEQDLKIAELERVSSGNSKQLTQMIARIEEIEKIACIKYDCKLREPKMGNYKHGIKTEKASA